MSVESILEHEQRVRRRARNFETAKNLRVLIECVDLALKDGLDDWQIAESALKQRAAMSKELLLCAHEIWADSKAPGAHGRDL